MNHLTISLLKLMFFFLLVVFLDETCYNSLDETICHLYGIQRVYESVIIVKSYRQIGFFVYYYILQFFNFMLKPNLVKAWS